MMDLDQDAVVAAADLIGRTGASDMQVGYLHDDVPAEQAGWYAYARYGGSRITVDNRAGPIEALEALARRLLSGAKCVRCGGLVTLSDDGAVVYTGGRFSDGTPQWTLEQAVAAAQCRWRRVGPRWVAGCEPEG